MAKKPAKSNGSNLLPGGNAKANLAMELRGKLRQAINRALNNTDGNGERQLQRIIMAQVNKAADGDTQAFKELMDRWAGKTPSEMSYQGHSTHEVTAGDSFIKLLDAMNRPDDKAKVIEGKVVED